MLAEMNIDEYLPHRYPMRLIDSILSVNDKVVRCKTIITEKSIFYEQNICGVYSWVGLELMAQTAGVFAYFQSKQSEPQVGLLLSMRKFSCSQPFFKLNDELVITAENIYLDESMGVFNCQIEVNGNLVASAKLSAIQSTELIDKLGEKHDG